MDNKTMLLVLMVVLIVFVVLMVVLGVVFIVALRKRAPVVKVVMAPHTTPAPKPEHVQPKQEQPAQETKQLAIEGLEPPVEEKVPEPEPEPEEEEEEDDDTGRESEDDGVEIITEGTERVRYDRSLTAKICQLKNETKEWYSEIKNELLSYENVKVRMSWRRESFRIGRMTVARIIVRGKTLCLALAVEPSGYQGTKYSVEDVSNIAAMSDTPTLFRIKSARRVKYAKEMFAGIMKELKEYKNPRYTAQDYFAPYEGDMALMQKGLVKRVVTNSTRTFEVREVDETQAEAAVTEAENSDGQDAK